MAKKLERLGFAVAPKAPVAANYGARPSDGAAPPTHFVGAGWRFIHDAHAAEYGVFMHVIGATSKPAQDASNPEHSS